MLLDVGAHAVLLVAAMLVLVIAAFAGRNEVTVVRRVIFFTGRCEVDKNDFTGLFFTKKGAGQMASMSRARLLAAKLFSL
jgi:hypothetical protein